MYFFPALVLAALPSLVAAAPFDESPRDGVSIPIAKRSKFRNSDGVVDMVEFQAGIQHTLAKIQRGFEVFQRNTGSAHPYVSLLKCLTNEENRQVPQVRQEVVWGWIRFPITVGTPAVTHTVDFDTGSSDLFLPFSNHCDSACDGHILYNPSASSTSNDVGQEFGLFFGNGSVSGEQYMDTVTLAGYKAIGQRLGAAVTYSSGFQSAQFPADGILGMGYESLSVFRATPVFQTLISQGQVSTPVFSLYPAESNPELYIGGTNKSHYRGSFTYVPVTIQGFWQVSFDGISVNGRTVVGVKSAIIDTGTSLVVGDTRSVRAIYGQIHGSQEFVIACGRSVWTIPCDFNTPIFITFAGKEFRLSASTFNVGPKSLGSRTCFGGFAAEDDLSFWVVGGVFLGNVYTTFDLGGNRVGFASLV